MGLPKNAVSLSLNSDIWLQEFNQEKRILYRVFGDGAIDIQHVGSTSIKGLMAKPIIDIAVGVNDLNIGIVLQNKLSIIGYKLLKDHGDIDRLFFAKGLECNRTHHLHVEIYNGNSWNNHILFRDYLNNHKDARNEYEKLKKRLASKYKNDRKAYTEQKANYIISIIQKSKINK